MNTATAFYNTDAERAFLTAMLKDRHATKFIRDMRQEDFYLDEHKVVFGAMLAAHSINEPITMPVLMEYIKSSSDADRYSAFLVRMVASCENGIAYAVEDHARIIKKVAFRRKLYTAIREHGEKLLDSTQDAQAVREDMRRALREMDTRSHQWERAENMMIETFEMLEQRAKGEEAHMPSGIEGLDKITGGFHRGELTIIGARPAVGKSALGIHIALAAADAGYKVGVCSREMTAKQYGIRIVARSSGIDTVKLRTGKLNDADWEKVVDSVSENGKLPVNLITTTPCIEDLQSAVQNLVDAEGMDMLIVDYLQLMRTHKNFDKDYLRIGYVSKLLKDMSVDFNIAVVALAQVNRSADGNMPNLSDLRGSGDLEQDADNVIFLHQPEDANDKFVRQDDRALFDTLPSLGMKYMVLDLAKHRQGETGVVATLFNPSRMMFKDIFRGMKGA